MQHNRLVSYRAQLDEWIQNTGDQGAAPETEESYMPIRRVLDRMEQRFLTRYGVEKLIPQNMYQYWMHHYGLNETN